jgi:predicted Zn-dependent protease
MLRCKTTYIRLFISGIAIFIALHTNVTVAMSEKKAAKIGKEMYKKIVAEMPIYAAPSLNNYVSEIGQRIVKYSDQPDATYTFTVINSPEINAFATPGGYVYINRGLLAYMNSEAQLAAVLAHEIAHITAQHSARQKRAQTGSNIVAGVLAVFTGSAEVGEATAMWGAAAVKGYGRDMELEADAIGARYLARAGYPGQAMITIISQLKDHERFMKKRAKESGKKVQSYHGLFSTHPRNDKRLLEMVKQSSSDNKSESADPGVVEFRIATEGLPWGQTSQTSRQKENRYYDNKLNFTFDYPDGWQFGKNDQQIAGQPEDKSATLSLDIKARTLDTPDQYIKNQLGIAFIRKSEPIVVSRLRGHTGVVPSNNSASDTRLAVIYYGRRAFVFKGKVHKGTLSEKHVLAEKPQEKSESDSSDKSNNENSSETSPTSHTYDNEFKSIIASFKPRSPSRHANQSAGIHYVKAGSSATYAKLAKHLNLGKYGTDELRLINGHYPGGEPQARQWIKIIR